MSEKDLKIRDIYYYHDPDNTGVAYAPFDDDEEVAVTLENGKVLYCWFFTPSSIERVMARHRVSGESCEGSFFWASNMIVIQEITKEKMATVLRDFIEVNGDILPFCDITDDRITS